MSEVENKLENRKLYNKLLLEKEQGRVFSKDDLNRDVLYELLVKEDLISWEICNLFNITTNQLNYLKKKFGLQNVFLLKCLTDEWKQEAYKRIKISDEDVSFEELQDNYYDGLRLYAKSKEWDLDFLNKCIEMDSGGEDAEGEYDITVTNRLHMGNVKRKLKSLSGGRKVNQVKSNEAKILSGNFGEQKVVEFENNNLKKWGIDKIAVPISKTEDKDVTFDGLGYDVESYNQAGEKIYIEVKTSMSSKNDVIFDISLKEVMLMQGKLKGIDRDHCFIYYVYNIDKELKTASIEIIDSYEFEEFTLNPIVYRVEEIYE